MSPSSSSHKHKPLSLQHYDLTTHNGSYSNRALIVILQLMGALTDGDSSACSTVDYRPPEPEILEEEEEEPEPLEPEACFTDSMNHLPCHSHCVPHKRDCL